MFASLSVHIFLVVRPLVCALGFVGIAWGFTTLPVFWRQAILEATAKKIVDGERFKASSLSSVLPEIENIENTKFCRPTALRSAAIVRLRMAEDSLLTEPRDRAEMQLNSARLTIRSALSCSPADPFLWLALYWVDTAQYGFEPSSLRYLTLSYRLGPNEGWIAEKRNRAAFAVYEKLPNDLADATMDEFISLLRSKLYQSAADIFLGPAWPKHELILSHLARIGQRDRELFADELSRRGYDMKIPDATRPDARPWN